MVCIFPPTRASISLREISLSEIRRSMLSQAIWWSSIALESLLLFRGFRGTLASRYQAFYFYISFVLFQDLGCMAIALWNHDQHPYTHAELTADILCVLVICGIFFEIYRVGL